MHILTSSFADERICHHANFFTVFINPTDHFRKALDNKAKVANTDNKIDEIVDKSAGHTDFMSTSRFQF